MSLLYDQSGKRKYLTIPERRAFLRIANRLPNLARTYCLALAYSGGRLSEVLALTPSRIDLENRVLIFESLKKRRRGVFRAVPVPAELLTELDRVHGIRAARLDTSSATQPLWTWGRTTAWKLVKETLREARVSGAQASPKGFRHGFAVSALQSGVPLNLVSKWLGHSRLSTTAIYADAVGEEEQRLAARFWRTFAA